MGVKEAVPGVALGNNNRKGDLNLSEHARVVGLVTTKGNNSAVLTDEMLV